MKRWFGVHTWLRSWLWFVMECVVWPLMSFSGTMCMLWFLICLLADFFLLFYICFIVFVCTSSTIYNNNNNMVVSIVVLECCVMVGRRGGSASLHWGVTDTVSAGYNVLGMIVYSRAIKAQNDILYRRVLLWFCIRHFLVYAFRFLGYRSLTRLRVKMNIGLCDWAYI